MITSKREGGKKLHSDGKYLTTEPLTENSGQQIITSIGPKIIHWNDVAVHSGLHQGVGLKTTLVYRDPLFNYIGDISKRIIC